MAARPSEYVRQWHNERERKGWWHSFELPDGTRIDGVASVESLRQRLAQFPIPDDLRGARVLDIGTWDGWFAFELERRGADVVAIDCWNNPRFHEVHKRLNSHVDYRELDVYDVTPDTVGRFDIVLFLGVLYHLKHPLLALERVCAVTEKLAAVESFIIREERPIMEFYEHDELGGQVDNWCGPTESCLLAFCRTAGFARVEHLTTHDYGAAVACFRTWQTPTASSAPVPTLAGVYHAFNSGINFQSRREDFVCAQFRSDVPSLTVEDVKPQVGPYGVRPVSVTRLDGDLWQANFILPRGLTSGWHDVRLALGDGLPSEPQRVAVDMPLSGGPLQITGLCDAATWEAGVVKGPAVSIWVVGLPENADRNNVRVLLDGVPVETLFVALAVSDAPRQVNAAIPPETPRRESQIEVSVCNFKVAAPLRVE